MLTSRLWMLVKVLSVGVVLAVMSSAVAAAATPNSIVGTWRGRVASRRFTVVVYRGERAGTWQIGSGCRGKLRLKDISDGYHHYYRTAGPNRGCAPLGIDCLKRAGTQMVDVFVPTSGATETLHFRRVR